MRGVSLDDGGGVPLCEGVRHLVHILFCLHTVLLLCGALVNGEREIEREREREGAGAHCHVLAGYSLTELRLYKKLKEETDGEEGRGVNGERSEEREGGW